MYEAADGWHVEMIEEIHGESADLNTAITAAKETLSHYVNRRGENPPSGLTAAGLSLWLMEKDDGTAMGIKLNTDQNEAEGPMPEVSDDVSRRVLSLMSSGRQIEAIRELRSQTNCSLAQAKAWLLDNER